MTMSLLKVGHFRQDIFSQEAGVPTPKFGLAKTAAEAKKIAEDIAGNDLVFPNIQKTIYYVMKY